LIPERIQAVTDAPHTSSSNEVARPPVIKALTVAVSMIHVLTRLALRIVEDGVSELLREYANRASTKVWQLTVASLHRENFVECLPFDLRSHN
jgi:hypothetical protein